MGLKKFRKIKAENESYWNLSCLFSTDIFSQIEEISIEDEFQTQYNHHMEQMSE